MGIKLDWEIEAEQSQVRTANEDPETARRRRRTRARLLMLVLLVIALVLGSVAVVQWRLREVDSQIEQLLRDTVEAEVTAIRIGDLAAFMGIQRSAAEEFLISQENLFDDYQALKLEEDLVLTGRVSEATIDNLRGRVKVEEIVGGVPYSRMWFYWRYEDGWRHVPPDYTFWGDVKTIENEAVTVRYQTVDEPVARDVSAKLGEWLTTGCAAVACSDLPSLMVEIVPDEMLQMGWSAANPWLLQLPSPYLDRARSDMPFDFERQLQVANLLAERLVAQATDNMQPVYPSDAYYLRQAVVAWLIGRFGHIDTNAFVVSSLAENYGEQSIARLLQVLQPTSDVSILNEVTGTPSLDQTRLDWRDFLRWRLQVESDLIAQRDEVNFLLLYDTREELVRNVAYSRFNAMLPAEEITVTAVQPEMIGESPHLRAQVTFGSDELTRQEEILFRQVDGVWRRVN